MDANTKVSEDAPDMQHELETAGVWDNVVYTLAHTRSARL